MHLHLFIVIHTPNENVCVNLPAQKCTYIYSTGIHTQNENLCKSTYLNTYLNAYIHTYINT